MASSIPGAWLPNSSSPDSKWIGPTANLNADFADPPSGTLYVYRISFDLSGFDPSSVVITGKAIADNGGLILLNGTSIGSLFGGFSSPLSSGFFTIDSGFVHGINTLDFGVVNVTQGALNPTGLRVELSGVGTRVEVGDHDVTVRVTDPPGLFDLQSYLISVVFGRNPPEIVSDPVVEVTEGVQYTYDVDAIDPDLGDVLTFSLDVAPAGMTIDPDTGLIEWTATSEPGVAPPAGQTADCPFDLVLDEDADICIADGFDVQLVSTLPGVAIRGGSMPLGPGGDWGHDLYLLALPAPVPAGTAPEIAVIMRVDPSNGEASTVATFPSRFDPDPDQAALAFYTTGASSGTAGFVAFDTEKIFGDVDAAGNPGLYVSSADSGKIYRVAPDGSISIFTNMRSDLGLSVVHRPLGLAFGPFGDFGSGLYACITSQVPPHPWRVVRYTGASGFSVFAQSTKGCGGMGFDATPSASFGGDLYARGARGFASMRRIATSGSVSEFSNLENLGSTGGLLFSRGDVFGEAIFATGGQSGGVVADL